MDKSLTRSDQPQQSISGPDPRGHQGANSMQRLTVCPDAIAYRVSQRVAELPDRTSPDDRPNLMLVTADELQFIVTDEINESLENGAPTSGAALVAYFRERHQSLTAHEIEEAIAELEAK
jgi:hypothetical protein